MAALRTAEELSSSLLRTLTLRLRGESRPRVSTDTDDKGNPLTELLIPHPTEPRFSVSLRMRERGGTVHTCDLWFGQAEITGALDPDDAEAAIEEIISDRIVAVIRYKNPAAYEDHRKSREWLFQLTGDEDSDAPALEALLARLASPAGVMDRLSGTYVGVFEVIRWSGCEVLERR